MPLVQIENIMDAELVLWRVSETEQELSSLVLPEDLDSISGFTSVGRRVERLAWRAALRSAGIRQSVIYNRNGVPFLKDSDRHISVSHCKEMACVAVSPVKCGVDIENVARDCSRIADRFLSERERPFLAGTPNPGMAAWCIKEALYKYAGRDGVDFLHDIRIVSNGIDVYEAVVCGETAEVCLIYEEGCVIAFAHAPAK